MTRPLRRPDLIVNFFLTAHRSDGSLKAVISGYRPIYKVQTDYHYRTPESFVQTA